ncbi:sialic acid-binding Ig-like lectin 13 [Narcine bancroftii]|uniref:sialic acid-binding Ig-like lectin 13 n=1 Tax=Narcine bancroftii TaxID=1343680 RepID=UPI00383227BC
MRLLLLSLLHTGIQGFLRIKDMNQPRLVSVRRGESVKLNCSFSYNGSLDPWVHISWQIRDSGTYASQNSSRLSCIPDVLPDGFKLCTESLKVESVSFGHSDYNYTCEVKIPSDYPPVHVKGQGTQMQIYDPPEISILGGALIADRKSILTCSSKGLYAKNITFIWSCPETNNFSNVTTATLKTCSDRTPVATSQLEIVPTMHDHGAVCSCQINHASFTQPAVTMINLNIMYGPRDPFLMYRLNTRDNYHPINVGNIAVAANSFLELACCVKSNPTPTMNWIKAHEDHNVMISTEVGSNSSKVWIQFQSEDEGTYWCMANNTHGWGNISISIKIKQADYYFLYALVPSIAVIIAVIICFCLICKRQWKDPVNVTTEMSPESMYSSANDHIDTVYAVVRKKSPSISRQSPTESKSDEEVSYADIVIHTPKQLCNKTLKDISDITEKSDKRQLKGACGPSPYHVVEDTSVYSAVWVSRQDVRIAEP